MSGFILVCFIIICYHAGHFAYCLVSRAIIITVLRTVAVVGIYHLIQKLDLVFCVEYCTSTVIWLRNYSTSIIAKRDAVLRRHP